MTATPLKPAIVLVRTQEEGNIGATARAMANMGLQDLVLVEPVKTPGRVARAFAVGAGVILDRARIESTLEAALEPYSRIIGTTSARARDPRVPLLTPSQLPKVLERDALESRSAIVFGPEASGLNNEELARCSHWVSTPCAPEQPTLNLAQAVLIVSYEIYLHRQQSTGEAQTAPPEIAATSGEVEGLFSQVVPLLEQIGFARDDTFSSVLKDLRQTASRAGLTSREITLIRGICRRAKNTLDRQTGGRKADGEAH